MSDGQPKHIPSANEFSPGQVDLRRVLAIIKGNSGAIDTLVEAIRREYFPEAGKRRSDPAEQYEQQRKRARNVLIGMKEYGLFDRPRCQLTVVGEELFQTNDDKELYEKFGVHVVSDCHGLELVTAVREMQLRQEPVNKQSLQRELENKGFKMSTATTDHTTLLNWLRHAGLFEDSGKYIIREDVFRQFSGITHLMLDDLSSLRVEQRAFLKSLKAIAEVHGSEPVPTKVVFENARRQSGSIFKEDQISAQILKPLAESGWLTRELKSAGRGGKSGVVAATQKLLDLDIDFLMPLFSGGIPPDLRSRLQTPLTAIYKDLKSSDTARKGLALELLSLRLIIDLGLTPVGFRERSKDTGGAEVDLVAEGIHLHFSRWLVQCKNTESVALSSLAKEIGMATLLRGHVILMVTTGRFASSVLTYAKQVAETTNLQVVLLDHSVLDAYQMFGIRALSDFFQKTAQETMRLKRPQTTAAIPTVD